MLINNTGNDGAVNVAILVPLKYLGNNWKTFEKPLINCEITLDIIWSENCVIFKQGRETTFLMTDAKLYVSVVAIITQDNVKLLQRLKSGFKRTISCNKYLSKTKTFVQNWYLDYLIAPSNQGINRSFILSFEKENGREGLSLPKVEIKDYNGKIDGRSIFDQPIKSNIKHMKALRKLLLVNEMIIQLVVY